MAQRRNESGGGGAILAALIAIALVVAAVSAFVKWLGEGDNAGWLLYAIAWVAVGVWAVLQRGALTKPLAPGSAAPFALGSTVVSLLVAAALIAYDGFNDVVFWLTWAALAGASLLVFKFGLSLVLRLVRRLPGGLGYAVIAGAVSTFLVYGLITAALAPLGSERRSDRIAAEEAREAREIALGELRAARRALRRLDLPEAARHLTAAKDADPDAPGTSSIEEQVSTLMAQAETLAQAEAQAAAGDPDGALLVLADLVQQGYAPARRAVKEVEAEAARLLVEKGRAALRVGDAERALKLARRAADYRRIFAVTDLIYAAQDALRPDPPHIGGGSSTSDSGDFDSDLPDIDIPGIPGE